MKKVFSIIVVFFLLGVFSAFSADDRFVLVIDPGHGGRDAGAVRGTYKEKSINLGVALALGKLIESNMKGVKVVYTRKSDSFVDLYKRAEIANKAKANLFVSIHTNSTASKTTSAQGADTYILGLARSEENLAVAKRENSVILLEDNYKKKYEGFDPNSPESYIIFEFMTDKYMEQSLDFATHVQRGFTRVAKRKDRGVRQAGFLVLRESAMPSVLIELGFINNPTEAKYLASSTGQRSMANAIYSGIEKYVNDFNKKRGRISTTTNTSSRTNNTSASSSTKTTTVAVTKADAAASKKQTGSRKTELMPPLGDTQPKKVTTNTDAVDTTVRNVFATENTLTVAPVVTRGKENVMESQPKNEIVVNNKTEEAVTTSKVSSPATSEKRTSQATKSASDAKTGKTEYRVQFLISQRKLPANSKSFKGLSPVKEYKDSGIYKYTYGSADTEAEALRIRAQVRKLFKDAFVVEFKNGVRVK